MTEVMDPVTSYGMLYPVAYDPITHKPESRPAPPRADFRTAGSFSKANRSDLYSPWTFAIEPPSITMTARESRELFELIESQRSRAQSQHLNPACNGWIRV